MGNELAPLKAMPMVAYHNSWPLLCAPLPAGLSCFHRVKPGVPPSPSHLAGILRTMKARSVRIVVARAA